MVDNFKRDFLQMIYLIFVLFAAKRSSQLGICFNIVSFPMPFGASCLGVGVSWCMPLSCDSFSSWGVEPISGYGRILWKCIPYGILSVWKEGKSWIFRNEVASLQ